MNSSEQRFRYLQSCFEQVKMYETAKKIDPNYKKEGIEDALVQVAQAYRYGENVKKDYNEALYYLTQAIMLGEGEAARIYGDIFTYDQWIGKSRFKKTNPIDCYNHAIELWETAAKNGCYKSAWNHYMYVRQVPEKAKKHVLSMVKNQSINCLSGKQITCEIDSICIHGDNHSSLATAKSIKLNLIENGLNLKPLNKMKKFI